MWQLLAPILVDFVILTKKGAVPHASTNIGGEDGETGFYRECSDTCNVVNVDVDGTSFPRMDFCECVAKLLVEDMTHDFGEINPDLAFKLGEYRKFEAPTMADSNDGHTTLNALTYHTPPGAERTSGRITVFVADKLPSGPHNHLEGSTFMNQLLAEGEPGAIVLLLGSVSRMGRRLSHEVGHVVGFHHSAGTPVTYVHDICEDKIKWPQLEKPTCEINIMGAWYDGPFCCPSEDAPTSGASCKAFQADVYTQQPYCCGDVCTHSCPDEQPPMTFATPEHKEVLKQISECWFSHVNKPLDEGQSKYIQSLLQYTDDKAKFDIRRTNVTNVDMKEQFDPLVQRFLRRAP